LNVHVSFTPEYVFEGEPAPGMVWDVAPGVKWLRVPLPFKLNHVNLWLLKDGKGWAIVDTGIDTPETRSAWDQVLDALPVDEPITRVIVTHFHPDHIGLAGWLCARFQVRLWMPFAEWTMGRMLSMDTGEATHGLFREFYQRAGFTSDQLAIVDQRMGGYASKITPIPGQVNRLSDGDVIQIGDHGWEVMTGGGHSPEHAALYCEPLGILISGDQVLPKISPNVSVWPHEPDADPLARFLSSLERFKGLPKDTLVLPSHNWPFRGLLDRLEDLAAHHEERLEAAWSACEDPVTATDVLKVLFTRALDDHQLFFAIGETVAHLHHLMERGRLVRHLDDAGAYRFLQRD